MSFLSATASASPRLDGATEDRVLVQHMPGASEGLVVALADGAGGIPGGRAAADLLIDTVARSCASLTGPEAVRELLRAVDLDLRMHTGAGECTAVVVVVQPGRLFGASCGDSGAWVVNASTHDELTAEQKPKLRLGSMRADPVMFTREGLEGTLVVGSDGLFKYVKPEVICGDARGVALEASACALVASARTRSGDLIDDVAVALVRRRP